MESPSALPDRLLSVSAVAALLGVSKRQVYRLEDAGEIPRSIKVGSCRRYVASEITGWIERLRKGRQ